MGANASSLGWLESPPEGFRAAIRTLPTDDKVAALATLSALVRPDLDLDQLTLASRTFVRQELLAAVDPSLRLRLLVLGNYTTSYLVDALPAVALRQGLGIEIVEAPYDQLAQEAFDSESLSHRSGANVVLLALDHRQLGLTGSLPDRGAAEGRADGVVALLASIVEKLGAALGAPILVQTLPQTLATLTGDHDAAFEGSLYAQIARVNRGIRDLACRPGCILLDLDRLATRTGLSDWHDARLWFAGKIPYALEMIPLVADHVARLLGVVRGRSRKCLVLDLDNTMWGGVIGDDGMAGIQIANGSPTGEAFRALQAYALEQRGRGVILAVCSKNEHDVALAVFRDHPDMLVREEHIAAFQVNWDDKATNLRRIAQTLNIGIDSLVFVDDNPAERLRVRQMLPDVAVPELPEDPAGYADLLSAASYFETLSLSDDDLIRAASYQANVARAAAMDSLGDMDSYLASLNMKATLRPFDAITCGRITQLINKSNQFNLTTRRYTEAEIASISNDPRFYTLQVRLADRFGDNGMIGVAIFVREESAWRCDTWLMSCRVLKRRVEELMLRDVATAAAREGCATLIGEYRPSAKNMIVADHYSKLGFVALDRDEEGNSRWRLDVGAYIPPDLPIKIEAA